MPKSFLLFDEKERCIAHQPRPGVFGATVDFSQSMPEERGYPEALYHTVQGNLRTAKVVRLLLAHAGQSLNLYSAGCLRPDASGHRGEFFSRRATKDLWRPKGENRRGAEKILR